MRVSVVNFCSMAVDMLKFSSRMLMKYAGTNDYDYIVITWNPSPEVIEWLAGEPEIIRVDYKTKRDLDYVPNLRQMFNFGFDAGYARNDWVVIVNTDMAFGRDWLVNLIRRATEDVIPNSLHLTPIKGSHTITVDLGVPTFKTFDINRFWKMHNGLYANKVETEEDRGGWRACATMPYIIHRKWWESCGPWEPNHIRGRESPDRRFFGRCHDAGVRFILVHNSICYHHEAVERRGKQRPIGVEEMPEGK